MFTGVIQEKGKVLSSAEGVLSVASKRAGKSAVKGASIAVNGVCLTVVKKTAVGFSVEVIPETYKCTTVGVLRKGDVVNLESALRVGDALDGHFVLGHVDAVGKVGGISKKGTNVIFTIVAPKKLAKYMAKKGSICVDGVALTIISALSSGVFTVGIIPTTMKSTLFGDYAKGDAVNIEVDALARYQERLHGK